MLELIETPEDDTWKARVYWYHRPPTVDYLGWREVKDQVDRDIVKWCQVQECNSLRLPVMGANCGIAFEHIADAVAFSLYWSSRLASLVSNKYTPDV
jgi:hypothetical protein